MFVISTDEKTSIQSRVRTHRGMAFGRTEPKTGIRPFMRLVEDVMSREPYASADWVFWIADNGSSHRGLTSINRMSAAWPNARLLHTPVHGSWLNQVEIYFSLIQRHVLTPNVFADLDEVATRLARYETLINQSPSPFNWNFTRHDLKRYLKRQTTRKTPGRLNPMQGF